MIEEIKCCLFSTLPNVALKPFRSLTGALIQKLWLHIFLSCRTCNFDKNSYLVYIVIYIIIAWYKKNYIKKFMLPSPTCVWNFVFCKDYFNYVLFSHIVNKREICQISVFGIKMAAKLMVLWPSHNNLNSLNISEYVLRTIQINDILPFKLILVSFWICGKAYLFAQRGNKKIVKTMQSLQSRTSAWYNNKHSNYNIVGMA